MVRIIKKLVRKYLLFSLKSTILSLYLPIIIIFILITGGTSYLLASKQTEENAFTNTQDLVYQSKSILDDRLYDVFEQLVALSNDPTILSVIAKKPSEITPTDFVRVDNHLERIYSSSNTIIDSIIVDIHEGQFSLSKSEYSLNNYDIDYRSYRDISVNKQGFYWENIHKDIIVSKGEKEVVTVGKRIGNESSSAEGLILFNIQKEFFERVLNKTFIGENGYLLLINQDSYVTFKTVSKEYQIDEHVLEYMSNLKDEKGDFHFQKPDGKKMFVTFDTLGVNKWKVAAVFPEEEILQTINYIKYVTISLVIGLIFIAVLLSNFLARYISNPLSNLVRGMNHIDENNLVFTSYLNAPREIEILQSGFDDLMHRINLLLGEVKKEQEEKRQLELKILHSQINPHFLYNTLYSVKALCDMGMTSEASSMVTALSTFFRISISKGKEIISVSDEIDHISNYLYIQEMRYGDDFSYKIDVDPTILSCCMIKLTLQPLVENAIYHGVKQTRRNGLIVVRGYQIDDMLCFEVKDNGSGISIDKVKEIEEELSNKNNNHQKIGFGVRSVHERIQLHYGNQFGLKINSDFGNGTIAKVLIPLVKG